MEMNRYASPFQIGNVIIPNRTVFAPMAGVSDLPFRLLCHEQGAGLVCMEMISAKAITFRSRRTGELWETAPEEKPVSLQIFGHEPDVMAEACRILEDQTFDILDINMGCPVPKIVGNQEGSALMKEIRRKKAEMFRALSIYFKVTFLHQDAAELLEQDDEEEE